VTRLIALPYSPWSEKARWALDHHRIEYEYSEHAPIVGDLRLRILLRKPKGRVTVPVLEDGGRWFTDSFEIAQHADRIGSGSRLFPGDRLAAVEAWNKKSEEVLAASRAIMIIHSADSPEAAAASLPPAVPAPLKPVLGRVARQFLKAFIAKYNMRDGADSHERTITGVFNDLRAALGGKKGYLIGDELSYADISMAVCLQFVSPVDERYMAIGPGGREGWTNRELFDRYRDLVSWRDELYAKHRKRG
jgi:glutathione S-transferase